MCRLREHPPLNAQLYLDEPDNAPGQHGKKKKTKALKAGKKADVPPLQQCLDSGLLQSSPPDTKPQTYSPASLPHDKLLSETFSYLHLETKVTDPTLDKSSPAELELQTKNLLLDGIETSTDGGSISGKQSDNSKDNEILGDHPTVHSNIDIIEEMRHRLLGYLICIDSQFNHIVCIFCHSLVPFHHTHTHVLKHIYGKNHALPFERQIPSKDILEDLLQCLNAHKPLELGTKPIPPFE
ncbi:hypothetical protein C0993_006160, partial [Termitomyces sp. T159_Od127]